MSKTYDTVTARILEQMTQGKIPWVKPWSGSTKLGETKNLISLKPYRGINAFLTMGFELPYFLTFKQANDLGLKIKAGSKGTPVVFWGKVQKEDEEDDKPGMFCKYYTVFNVSQLESMPDKLKKLIEASTPKVELTQIETDEKAEKLLKDSKADVRFEQQKAFYSPQLDYINMPLKDSFTAKAEYYSTLFHELGHWTGHSSRLDRKELTESAYFGSHAYSQEELTAELTAAFVCSSLGISTESSLRNSTAYLQGWMSKLKNDPKLFTFAAQRAQKASDLILGLKK